LQVHKTIAIADGFMCTCLMNLTTFKVALESKLVKGF